MTRQEAIAIGFYEYYTNTGTEPDLWNAPMKVSKKNLNARNDWLLLTDEREAVSISLLAHRTEICVSIKLDGKQVDAWIKPRRLAEILTRTKL